MWRGSERCFARLVGREPRSNPVMCDCHIQLCDDCTCRMLSRSRAAGKRLQTWLDEDLLTETELSEVSEGLARAGGGGGGGGRGGGVGAALLRAVGGVHFGGDACCGHGNEDGWCEPVPRATKRSEGQVSEFHVLVVEIGCVVKHPDA